jgi:hypothetical protein
LVVELALRSKGKRVADRHGSLERMLLEIRGHHLPGRSWWMDGEPCGNVHVGIQVGRQPRELVPGDAESAAWTTPIEVVERDGAVDFRGPAVQGKRGDRFVYLTWGNVRADGSFTMFRRAKLMLGDLHPLLADAGGAAHVVATVDLTDECGGPRCARLRPPALTLAAGVARSG